MHKLVAIYQLRELRRLIADEERDGKPCVVVCAGTACQASGANDILRIAKRHILENNLVDRVGLRITGCHGFCEMGPFLLTEPQNAFYSQIKLDDVPLIIEAMLEGRYIDDLLYRDPVTGQVYRRCDDIPFFKNQQRMLLEMNRKIDPIRIYDYIAQGGYGALEQILSRGDHAWVIEQMKKSGLRGRGGAGFPTGLKWELLARQPDARGKFLVCNADEGDPGAYMDRSVLEGNPHSIIEGMIIGAYATGATEGVVYVRNEYPLAVKHLGIALRQARDLGVLGANILGTGFGFDIAVAKGAGAFVCGEETALMRSVEGKVGEPRQRPPYPVERGIDGKPTAINNVETWANVPLIFRIGADRFAGIGTDGNSGCKIFSLVGKIKNTGLVEVPMGITVGKVIYDIGGGPIGARKIKAVQTGGPSGGCIPSRLFDLPIDYDSLAKAGSIMGSGGMIVMDEATCMVDVAKYFMRFLKDESCGKCFTCRKGTQRMFEILEDVSEGKATLNQLDLLEQLAVVVKDTSMCGLGQTASNPVLSTLRYFRNEFERHIIDKRCDALVCKDLVGAPCQAACPLGTEAWRYVAHITRGEYDEAYRVIREANPLPSVCGRVCDHPCEQWCRAGTSGGDAIAIRALKRFITDRADPSSYQPKRSTWTEGAPPRVAIIGAGPAGLTAAHYLSLQGCRVTIYEAECEPGGMLYCAIPSYRLPRAVIKKEIDALLDENITVEYGAVLGRDINVDDLLNDGFSAVLLALGAHKSKPLRLEGESAAGVYPSIEFLKSYNLRGESLACGRVGIIGGGNSAIDAARLALRQQDVTSVTILYRRTRDEMPAFAEEIEAAEQEGIGIETLVTPTRVVSTDGRLVGLECVRNQLGDAEADGRRRPVPMPRTEHVIPLDTVIVAIGEDSGVDAISPARTGGIEITQANTVAVHPATLQTNRAGVFAAGDIVTGPNTVVEAIAAGKKAAVTICRYLRHEPLVQPVKPTLPREYIPPAPSPETEVTGERAETPRAPAEWRRRNFAEVEVGFSVEEAGREACRCLRCDLEFTRPDEAEALSTAIPAQQEVTA